MGAEKPKQICGSADIDAALTPSHPNEPRGDYVVCRQASRERLFWIEVHPANGGNRLREMEGKISWLRKWLDGDARLLRSRDQEFIWVASGGSAYTQRSPAIKQLALQGLQFKGGYFEIPAE